MVVDYPDEWYVSAFKGGLGTCWLFAVVREMVIRDLDWKLQAFMFGGMILVFVVTVVFFASAAEELIDEYRFEEEEVDEEKY